LREWLSQKWPNQVGTDEDRCSHLSLHNHRLETAWSLNVYHVGMWISF
jgi:hypothetical protein